MSRRAGAGSSPGMAARVPPLSTVLLAESPAPADAVESVLTVLRREHDATDEARARSRLLTEMAAIHERRDDLASAARDELAATNADPALLEPLEALIGIARRRRSQKNASKLVERLARVSQTSPERRRAAFELAAQERRDEQWDDARRTLERALSDAPDDPAAWLALETLATKLDDPALRERALTGRAGVSSDPEWRSLLLLDCARLRLEAGDQEAALALLRQASDEYPSLRALEQWERSALAAGRYGDARDAAEALAGLVQKALGAAEEVPESAVLRGERTPQKIAAALLRASEWARRDGDVDWSTTLLTRAVEVAPSEPLLRAGQLIREQDPEALERLLREELARHPEGAIAAALWLRIADLASARGDTELFQQAIFGAKRAEPDSLVARALDQNRVEAEERGPALLERLEGEAAADEAGRAQHLGFAALVTALDAAGTEEPSTRTAAASRARDLLTRARETGASALTTSLLGRVIGSTLGDRASFEQATFELLPQVTDDERRALELELVRLRLLRRDVVGAESALKGATESLLGAALSCYVAPLLAENADDGLTAERGARFEAALRHLGSERGDRPEISRAILGAALTSVERRFSSGAHASARAKLRALHEEMPASAAVAAALADLVAAEDPASASLVLSHAAEKQSDEALAAAWYLRAAVLSWRANQRATALSHVQKAHALVPAAARPWLVWAERSVVPNDVTKRRELLELDDDRGAFVALERMALGLAENPGLDLTVSHRESDEDAAFVWLSALSAASRENEAEREYFDRLEEDHDELRGFFALLEYARALSRRAGQPSSDDALEAAKAWAEQSNGVDAALAWLTEARALGRATEEARARVHMGKLLESTDLRASGGLLGALAASLSGASLPGALDDELRRALLEASPLGADPTHVPKAVRWGRLELATPGGDTGLRSDALEALARPTGDADAVADDAQRATLLALAGFNRVSRGEYAEALSDFREVVAKLPSDLMGWEGIRQVAALQNDAALEAEACTELARCIVSDEQAAALWERGGVLYQDVVNDSERAEEAFSAALSRDYARDTAFERLFRLVRSRGDQARLLELVEGRLAVTDDGNRLRELLWEKARLARRLDNRQAVHEALDTLLSLEPSHLSALALASELHLSQQHYDQAADYLSRLASHPDAPAEQRRLSALAAADLYETRLHSPAKGLEVLARLGTVESTHGADDAELVERRAITAARAEQWPAAADAFQELLGKSREADKRLSAASFLLAIARDKLDDVPRAALAARAVLSERPDDADAIDFLMTNEPEGAETRAVLERARDACRVSLGTRPLEEAKLRLLLRMCEALESRELALAALGALDSLSVLGAAETRHLDDVRAQVLRDPTARLKPEQLEHLASGAGVVGPLPRAARTLVASLSATLSGAFEPTLEALGATASGRIDPFTDDPVRRAVSPWATAVGLDDFELYVGGNDPRGVSALALALPTLVLGSELAPPFAARERAAIFSALFSLSRGTTSLTNRSPDEGAALLGVVARAAGDDAPEAGSVSTDLEERFKRSLETEQLAALAEQWQTVRAELGSLSLVDFCAGVAVSALCVGALATGEASAPLEAATSQLGATTSGNARKLALTADLVAFTLSDDFAALRRALGTGAR